MRFYVLPRFLICSQHSLDVNPIILAGHILNKQKIWLIYHKRVSKYIRENKSILSMLEWMSHGGGMQLAPYIRGLRHGRYSVLSQN